MNDLKVGISAVTAYVPPYRVDLQKWCSWSENHGKKLIMSLVLVLGFWDQTKAFTLWLRMLF